MPSPEFFDVFGVGAFVIVILTAITALRRNGTVPLWLAWILLIVGILGFTVDLVIVHSSFLR